MDVTTNRRALAAALQAAARVIPAKPVVQTAANVVLRPEKATLELWATNGDGIWLSASVPTSGATTFPSSDPVMLPGKSLADVVKNQSGDDVRLRLVKDGRQLEVASARSSFKLSCMSARDFPGGPEIVTEAGKHQAKWAMAPAAPFLELLEGVDHSISTDDARPHLCGAFVKTDDKGTLAAGTDGHRLGVIHREVMLPFDRESGLIPHKGLKEIGRLLQAAPAEVVGVSVHKQWFAVSAAPPKEGKEDEIEPTIILAVKLSDAKFPPYEQVVPDKARKLVVVSRGQLLEVLGRVSLLAGKSHGVLVEVKKNGLHLSAEDPDSGSAEEGLPALKDVDSRDFGRVGVSARYLDDALRALKQHEEITFDYNDELEPIKLHAGGDACVIMPLRM